MILRRFLIVALTTLLIGCGFHLRGFNVMPRWLSNVAITIQNAHRDLGPILKEQLEAYKIRVNPNHSQADYLLIVESDAIQQQITNVGASTTARQYLLIYVAQFKLIKTKGAEIIPSTFVSVTRQLTVNNDRNLGSNFEEMQIATEMRRDAALQIMNRIAREARKSR